MQISNVMSPLEVLVGIDIGGTQHSVAVGLSDGSLLDEFDIGHHPAGFIQFFERITKHSDQNDGCGVRVAMEGYNGYARPLDMMVQQRNWPLYSINIEP